jgi:hypothetical protein
MDKDYGQLDDVFNVSGEVVPKSVEITSSSAEIIKSESQTREEDLKRDYNYTRGTIYSLLEKGQEAINGMLEVAQETESARAYEVVGQLIKSVSDTADKLANLHKTLKDIEETKISGPTNVTNALFVGSTAELSKLLKSQREANQEDK